MASGLRTTEEWNETALEMLRDLGVSNPKVGMDGSFGVTPGRRKVLTKHTVEDTPSYVRMFNNAPDIATAQRLMEPLAGGPVCDLPCAFIELLGVRCCHTETSWTDPRIRGEALPVRIPEATVYLNPFNARVEGDIRTAFENGSEPGERHTQEVCKCRQNGDVETETVEGSATVDEQDDQNIVVSEMDELLDEVTNAADNVRPGVEVEREAEFRKEGALDVIESLLSILTTGTMEVNADISTTVTFRWRGRSRQKDFSTSAEVILPVDDVNYSW